MKAIVDHKLCIGCGICVDTCPSVFKMVDDKAVAILTDVPESDTRSAKETVETCPAEAIKIR